MKSISLKTIILFLFISTNSIGRTYIPIHTSSRSHGRVSDELALGLLIALHLVFFAAMLFYVIKYFVKKPNESVLYYVFLDGYRFFFTYIMITINILVFIIFLATQIAKLL